MLKMLCTLRVWNPASKPKVKMLDVRLQYPELVYIAHIILSSREKANYSEKEKVLLNTKKLIFIQLLWGKISNTSNSLWAWNRSATLVAANINKGYINKINAVLRGIVNKNDGVLNNFLVSWHFRGKVTLSEEKSQMRHQVVSEETLRNLFKIGEKRFQFYSKIPLYMKMGF